MDAKIFFSQAGVSVTNTQFITHKKTFAIEDIESVTSRLVEPARDLPILLFIVGLAMTLDEGALFVIGGITIATGLLVWLLSNTRYAIFIKTSIAEYQPLKSADRLFIEAIVQAIEAAIINRIDPRDISQSVTPEKTTDLESRLKPIRLTPAESTSFENNA